MLGFCHCCSKGKSLLGGINHLLIKVLSFKPCESVISELDWTLQWLARMYFRCCMTDCTVQPSPLTTDFLVTAVLLVSSVIYSCMSWILMTTTRPCLCESKRRSSTIDYVRRCPNCNCIEHFTQEARANNHAIDHVPSYVGGASAVTV